MGDENGFSEAGGVAGVGGFRPGIAGGTNGGRVMREPASCGLNGDGPPVPGPRNGGITGFGGRAPSFGPRSSFESAISSPGSGAEHWRAQKLARDQFSGHPCMPSSGTNRIGATSFRSS